MCYKQQYASTRALRSDLITPGGEVNPIGRQLGPNENQRVCPLHVEKSAWKMQAETQTFLARNSCGAHLKVQGSLSIAARYTR